ncbi:MAG: hypothetical protein KGJ23_02405 [Euryarchaeota archaeon]|nr:hypothetical protein [Euryarchaeota archaeon]MDE1835448.1 hypothetical protein [Euryarchaeota archaeon]MDE1879584.1 hypothetical protein [Euryarchaeota archaeon]MDE2046304.1 hypothetical protein [Thermoplasmata archaeon]
MPPARKSVEPPAEFGIQRDLLPGRYPLLKVFPGLDRIKAFRALPGKEEEREVLTRTQIEVVPEDVWMYVAPHRVPSNRRARWRPVVSAEDCVVVGHSHLVESPPLVVYLDILHELCHVIQRFNGRELWDPEYAYVDRPTELEAYEVAIREARRLGAQDTFLRDYLRVEWVSERDFRRLLRHLSVAAS